MNIQQVREQYPQYDDMSDSDLADAMYDSYYSDMDRAEFNQAIGMESEGSVLNPIAQGATLGFADELAAMGAAATGKVLPEFAGGFPSGADVGQAYGEIRDQIREETEQYAEENPGKALAAEVAGGVLTGGAGAQRALGSQAVKQAAQTAPRLAPAAAVSGVGAVEGGIYGAGTSEEIDATGEDFMRGAATGAVLAPALSTAANVVGRKVMTPGVNKAVEAGRPLVDRVANRSRQLYSQARDLGVKTTPDAIVDVMNKLPSKLKSEGYHPKLHPKVAAVVGEVKNYANKGATLEEIEQLRRMTNAARSSLEPDEQRVGRILADEIDDFIENLAPEKVVSGDAAKAGTLLKEARSLWRKKAKHDLIADSIEKAGRQASGFENGIKIQLRQILNSKKRRAGFTKDEIDAMKQIVEGDTAGNLLRTLGRLAPGEGAAHNLLTSMAGMGMGGAAFGLPGAIAVPALGYGARKVAASRASGQVDDLLANILGTPEKRVRRIVDRNMQPITQKTNPASAYIGGLTAGGLFDDDL